jgi:hypothetical protein
MVAHFVSADYSYLQSPDATETACILFKASKGHNRYYTNKCIIQHAKHAIKILQKYYPNDDYILIFDNTMTHIKRADNTLSAVTCPKTPHTLRGSLSLPRIRMALSCTIQMVSLRR